MRIKDYYSYNNVETVSNNNTGTITNYIKWDILPIWYLSLGYKSVQKAKKIKEIENMLKLARKLELY
jgi:hypothetical protein